jgi:cobalt-zinc-cadmium efflux system membrane fusion protein
MGAATILLVDDDETLSRVLRRVLIQQGYTVVEAGTVARALQVARESPPQLGLLDLRLPDGDGVELARKLTAEGCQFPVILMTAYPLRLRDQPELASQFARVLTKPLNLQELRQSIDTALAEASAKRPPAAVPAVENVSVVSPEPTLPPAVDTPSAATPADAPPARPTRRRNIALLVAIVLALACLGALPALGIVHLPGRHNEGAVPAGGEGGATLAGKTVAGDPDGLELPPAVVESLGLTTVVAEPPAGKRPLRLSGFVNYDPDYMQRVHALFSGEIIEIPEVEENVHGTTERRKLSFNDSVHKGDLLAVVWSKDLGQMKSALVDAIVHQLFDEETLTRLESLYASGGTSEAAVRAQRAQVSIDRNNVATAERSLGVARVPAEEVQAVKDEGRKIFDRRGEHDPAKEKDWPRVEVRSRIDGTIVVKNVAVGDTVDTSFDMFQIADLSKLTVWASAYEEDLRELNNLTLPYPWKVELAADPRASGEADKGAVLTSDFLEKVTPSIDPNQHTATLMGRVTPGRSQTAFVGRMVAVTINLRQPRNTVAVPVSALDEDGESSVVFVQPDPDRPVYSQRRVAVVQRLTDVVLVSSSLTAAEREAGLQPLQPGDRVVTRQTYLLRGALADAKNAAREKNAAKEQKK